MRNAVLLLLVWTAVGMCQVVFEGATTTWPDDHRTKGKNEYLLIVSHQEQCDGCIMYSSHVPNTTVLDHFWFPTAQEAVDWLNKPEQKYTFLSFSKISDIPLKQVDQKVIEKQTKPVEVEVEILRKKYVLP